MKRFGRETLDQALTLLGEVLNQRGHPPEHFVSRYDQIHLKLYATAD
jgi:hypothetical protein